MSSTTMGLLVFCCVFGAASLAMWLRAKIPQHHLSTDTKDTVKLAMGLVATMAALVLGLLVASAKGAYDSERTAMTQMAAKIAFLDRVLALHGPEAAATRELLHGTVERMVDHIWPSAASQPAQLDPSSARGDAVYSAIQSL